MLEPHFHDNIDTPRIKGRDILGFPVTSTAPTDNASEGTIRVYYSGGVCRLYIRANQTWIYRTINNT